MKKLINSTGGRYLPAELLRLTAALLLVGIIGFYLFVFRKEILTFFGETLLQSIKALFASKNKRAHFGAFYKFDHKDVEEWIQWMQSADAEAKQKAFDKITRFLSKDSKQLSTIIKDISKVMLGLYQDEAYAVFEDLLYRSRQEWTDSNSASACYEEASLALMKIDAEEAQNLLMEESKEIGEDQEYKAHIASALSLMNDEEKLEDFYKDLALDPSNTKDLKALTLNLLKDKNNPSLYSNYLRDLTQLYIEDEIDKNSEILAVCFEHYLGLISDQESTEELWSSINDYCKDEKLAPLITSSLANKIKDKGFKLDGKWLLTIYTGLDTEQQKILEDVLIYRYTISEQEQELLKITQEYENFAEQIELDLKANFKDLEPEANFSLYKHVDKLYPGFEEVVDKHQRSIRVISGNAGKDKLFMAQQYAIQKKMKTMCINADLLMLSPDLVSRIDKLISDEYKLLYFYNSYEFMWKITVASD
ncbi:MAG: hypothetical protein OXU45_00985, partial [Candidatus Melainabacteria bacterium]|nr:hypothetical protein [Candidatus Melainabacteria bacterium]